MVDVGAVTNRTQEIHWADWQVCLAGARAGSGCGRGFGKTQIGCPPDVDFQAEL